MNKKTFCYARVSTGMQSSGLEAQVRALQEFCESKKITNFVVFQDENQSGAKKSRPALDEMMKRAKTGECEKVIVYSFSRFARSVTHLLTALQDFESMGVKFISISESIDTDTPIGRALFTILGSVAQLERDLIAERVRVGLHNAKMKGIRIGRKKTRPSELIRRLRAKGVVYKEIARIANCSQGSVAAEIRQWNKEKREGIAKKLSADIPPPLPVLPKEAFKKEKPPNPMEIIRF